MGNMHFGGCFAPPLSDELLVKYRGIIDTLPASAIKDAMAALYVCCAKWWELPDSLGTRVFHPSIPVMIMPISAENAALLEQHIPWKEELESMQVMFNGIPTDQTDLRDAAFHLLWHIKELERDREPLTTDKLQEATVK